MSGAKSQRDQVLIANPCGYYICKHFRQLIDIDKDEISAKYRISNHHGQS